MALTKISTGMLKQDAASSDLNIDAGTLYLDVSNNRVGIANTSPSQTLHVNGMSQFDNTMLFASRGAISWGSMGGGTGFGIRAESGNALSFGSNGVWDKAIIDTAGRLLINATTTAHNDKLYVNGDAYVTGGWRTGTNTTFVGELKNSSGKLTLQTDANRDIQIGDTTTPDIVYVDTSAQNVGIGTTSPNEKIQVGGNIHAYAPSGINAALFASTAAGSTTIAIRSSGITHFNGGNVGIGTTSPAQKLHIKDTSTTGGILLTRESSNAGAYLGVKYQHSASDSSYYAEMLFRQVDTNHGGQIEFWTDNSVGTAAQRMTINKSGNVGIGTTAPASNLHVKTSVDNSVAQGLIIERSANSDKGYINYTGGGFQFRSTVGDPIVFGETDAEHMRIIPDGNVGIGTNSPDQLLHVEKSSGTTLVKTEVAAGSIVGFEIAKTGTTTQSWRIVDGATVNGVLEFYDATNSATRMAIKGDGNVGIGTTNPAQNFVVAEGTNQHGIELIPGTLSYVQAYDRATSDYGDLKIDAQSIRFGTDNGTERARISSTGRLHINHTTDPSWDSLGTLLVRQIANDIGIGVVDANSQNTFKMLNNETYAELNYNVNLPIIFTTSGAERLRIHTGGNVGIGTDSPTAQLDVRRGDASGKIAEFHNNVGYGVDIGSSTAVAYISSGYNQRLDFKTDPTSGQTERMSILANGNVGIGTTSPAALLHVKKDVDSFIMKVENDGNSAGTSGASYADASDGLWVDTRWNTGSNTPFKVTSNSGNTPMMIIKGNGKVGIGTATPYGKLQIEGNTNTWSAAPLLIFSSSSTTHTSIRDWSIGPADTSYGYFHINQGASTGADPRSTSNVRFTISDTGNVGIGTATPDYQLDIENTSGHAMARLHSGTNGSSSLRLQNDAQHFDVNLQTNDKFAIYDHTAGTQPFTIMPTTGNVGIGTATPDHKLDVNGNIRLTSTGVSFLELNSGTSGSKDYRIYNGQSWNPDALLIYNHTNDATVLTIEPGKLGINRGANSLTQALEVDGGAWISDNVGIGTASPTAKLQVAYNGGHTSGNAALANSSLDLYNPLAANTDEKGSILTFSDNYFDGSNYFRTTRAAIKGGTDVVGNDARGFLSFFTNSSPANALSERMRVTNTGLVGIGTTSPQQTLQVNGNVRINQPDLGGSPGMTALLEMHGYEERGVGIKMRDSVNNASGGSNREWFVGTGYGQSGFNIGYSSTGSQSSYAAQNKLTITQDGKVGIGTTNPAYTLDVDGAIRTGAGLVAGKVYPYQKSITRALNDPTRWYKIYSVASASSRVVGLKLQATGDNSNFMGEFTVNLAGYGFKHSIKLENYTYYNGTQLLDIATKIASDNVTIEIYVQVDPLTSYAGSLIVNCTDDNVITPTIVSEPSGVNTRLHSRHFPATTARNTSAMTSSLNLANGAGLNFFRSDDTRSGSLFHNNSGTVLRTNNNGDNLYLQANGTGNIYLQPTQNGYATVINEDGNDVDFRVESDTESHAFTVDGETGQVGVGSRRGFRFGNSSLQGNAGSSGGGYPVIGYNIRFQETGNQYGTLVTDTSWRIDLGTNHRLTVHSRSSTAAVTGAATYTSGPYVALNGTSWTSSSDARLKENVNTITGAIDKVKAMNPVNFTWIHDDESLPQVGFIAQEMALVVPEVVDIPEDDEVHQGIQYEKLAPVLTAALQEALTKIENLEARIAQLES